MRRLHLFCEIALLLFVLSCQTQPPETPNKRLTLPSNTEVFDGISHSSIGSASLSTSSGSTLTVSGMSSSSDGVSTDFLSKTEWTQFGKVNWPSTGNSTVVLYSIDGTTTTSTLTLTCHGDTNLIVEPAFTGQSHYQYNLSV